MIIPRQLWLLFYTRLKFSPAQAARLRPGCAVPREYIMRVDIIYCRCGGLVMAHNTAAANIAHWVIKYFGFSSFNASKLFEADAYQLHRVKESMYEFVLSLYTLMSPV